MKAWWWNDPVEAAERRMSEAEPKKQRMVLVAEKWEWSAVRNEARAFTGTSLLG